MSTPEERYIPNPSTSYAEVAFCEACDKMLCVCCRHYIRTTCCNCLICLECLEDNICPGCNDQLYCNCDKCTTSFNKIPK